VIEQKSLKLHIQEKLKDTQQTLQRSVELNTLLKIQNYPFLYIAIETLHMLSKETKFTLRNKLHITY